MIEYTSPWVLEYGTDPLDPTEIDWSERQARALIPFEVREGRPRCPQADHQIIRPIYGRNDMRFWGENPMADALVTATCRGVRYVLLIEREDGAGWAMPGGAIEPGETPLFTAKRELREETGLIIPMSWFDGLDEPRWVPDPRGSMEAWAVTVVACCDLGEVDTLPEVRGGDDARRAEWCTIYAVEDALENGEIFPAHREILGALR